MHILETTLLQLSQKSRKNDSILKSPHLENTSDMDRRSFSPALAIRGIPYPVVLSFLVFHVIIDILKSILKCTYELGFGHLL
jgi:hypothetical protein